MEGQGRVNGLHGINVLCWSKLERLLNLVLTGILPQNKNKEQKPVIVLCNWWLDLCPSHKMVIFPLLWGSVFLIPNSATKFTRSLLSPSKAGLSCAFSAVWPLVTSFSMFFCTTVAFLNGLMMKWGVDALLLGQLFLKDTGSDRHSSFTPSHLKFQEEDTISNLGKLTFPCGDLFSFRHCQLFP